MAKKSLQETLSNLAKKDSDKSGIKEMIDLDSRIIKKGFALALDQPEAGPMLEQMLNYGGDLSFALGFTIFNAADVMGDMFAQSGVMIRPESFFAPNGGFDAMYDTLAVKAQELIGADIDKLDPTLRQRTMNTIMELSKALDMALKNGKKQGQPTDQQAPAAAPLTSFGLSPEEAEEATAKSAPRSLQDFLAGMGGF